MSEKILERVFPKDLSKVGVVHEKSDPSFQGNSVFKEIFCIFQG